MRIWDIPVSKLCRNHLLGEHRELHAIWNILTQKKRGYSFHPETLRWKGKIKALYLRHQEEVAEMERRGYKHRSPLPKRKATGKDAQDVFVDSIKDQKKILKKKGCKCLV
ncbi:pyrimidine dimer DNA glycosylase/endonuclease V [Candidatus Omnitrophota bacterium]